MSSCGVNFNAKKKVNKTMTHLLGKSSGMLGRIWYMDFCDSYSYHFLFIRHFNLILLYFEKLQCKRRRGRATPPIKIYVPGALKAAKNLTAPIDLWKILITENMIENIVKCTNIEIEDRRRKRIAEKREHQPPTP